MATEFKILRGLSTKLINNDGSPKLSQDKLVNGYWYLTDDTAEVFVCLPRLEEPEKLWLYKINDIDTSNFATKEEIPSITGLASEEFVLQKIAEAELAGGDVNLDNYYTKTQVDNKDYIKYAEF